MLNLKEVTLVAVACTKVPETIDALQLSQAQIKFARCLLLTDKQVGNLPDIQVKKIKLLNYQAYNHFILFELHKYIHTKYCLVVQNDGYVVRPGKWISKFLKYDYIGAPWPEKTHFTADGKEVRVGNGGFSLRSHKLLSAPSQLKLAFTDAQTGYFHEDGFLCVHYRHLLEKKGIKFAPVNVAAKFSRELWCAESVADSFGFHKYADFSFSIILARIKRFLFNS